MIIRFNRVAGPYGVFSNFAPSPIRLRGRIWPTVEHYFQAQKLAGTAYEEEIRHAHSPGRAKEIAWSYPDELRSDWEDVKVSVMQEAVLAKFEQHADLRALLLGTGEAVLVEHRARDSFWGDGGDGKGANMLGRILMEVREQLKRSPDI